MTEQEKREKVIKGLGACWSDVAGSHCGLCPYKRDEGDISCCKRLQADAIELLKAQEPRVMTLEEVKQHNDPIYIECKYRSDWALRCCYVENTIYFAVGWRNGSSEHLYADMYGITWRCWTSRPTDAQREAVKWE